MLGSSTKKKNRANALSFTTNLVFENNDLSINTVSMHDNVSSWGVVFVLNIATLGLKVCYKRCLSFVLGLQQTETHCKKKKKKQISLYIVCCCALRIPFAPGTTICMCSHLPVLNGSETTPKRQYRSTFSSNFSVCLLFGLCTYAREHNVGMCICICQNTTKIKRCYGKISPYPWDRWYSH